MRKELKKMKKVQKMVEKAKKVKKMEKMQVRAAMAEPVDPPPPPPARNFYVPHANADRLVRGFPTASTSRSARTPCAPRSGSSTLTFAIRTHAWIVALRLHARFVQRLPLMGQFTRSPLNSRRAQGKAEAIRATAAPSPNCSHP